MSSLIHLTRRGFIAASAATMIPSIGRSAIPSCILTPEQEEGPYYVDDEKLRADLTEGKPGVPLRLRVAVLNAKTCAPLPNAAIDIWHCDALGVYSGFTSSSPDGDPFGGPGDPEGSGGRGRGFGGPPAGPGRGARQIDKTRFFRGVQISDANGFVEFTTIYPGWYFGRTIHIHVKVHTAGHVSHTGQFFFPEEITQDVAKLPPYSNRSTVHRTSHSEDGVFNSQQGSSVVLTMDRLRKGSNAEGFMGTIALAVDPEAAPQPVGIGGAGRGPSRRLQHL